MRSLLFGVSTFAIAGALALACSSSSNETTSSGGNSSSGGYLIECSSVCKRFGEVCPSVPPNCDGDCQGYTEPGKDCIVKAADCTAAKACDPKATVNTSSSSSGSTTDPCTGCTGFCITASTNTSEVGCYKGTCTDCACLTAPTGGPCAFGTSPANCNAGTKRLACN